MVRWPVSPLSLVAAAAVLSACAQEPVVRPSPAPAAAARVGGSRGIIECPEDHACGVSTGSAGQTPAVPVRADDVTIRYLRPGADGGRRELQNGSTLAPGEVFTILIEARRDAYVYLWHTDPRGRLVELVGASGALGSRDCAWANRLHAGQTVQLPAAGEHYTLDRSAGVERIYPVISAAPLCGANRTVRDGPPVGAGAHCSAGAGACGEVFVIHHLAQA